MPSHILHIAYTVPEKNREAYLALARQLRDHFAGDMGKSYSIYEVKGRRNAFVEQFICASEEEFEKLEDDMSDRGEELINKLTALIEDGKAKYSTFIEI